LGKDRFTLGKKWKQSLKIHRIPHWHGFSLTVDMKQKKPVEMISLNEFRYSSFEKKCDLITGYSNYITMRHLGDCKVYLYHTGKFFIEVYYSPGYQKVLMIHALNDATGLVPYVEAVSLAEFSL
jgi:hypothetical protein